MNRLHVLCERFYKSAESKSCKIEECKNSTYGSEFCYKHLYRCDLCNKETPTTEPPTKYNGTSKACPDCISKLNQCSVCDDKLSAKNIIKAVVDHIPQVYCIDCLPENKTVECPKCDEQVDTGTLHEYKDHSSKKIGCEECCGTCNACSEWKDKESDLQSGPDNEYYCDSCYSDSFAYCE